MRDDGYLFQVVASVGAFRTHGERLGSLLCGHVRCSFLSGFASVWSDGSITLYGPPQRHDCPEAHQADECQGEDFGNMDRFGCRNGASYCEIDFHVLGSLVGVRVHADTYCSTRASDSTT